MVDYELCKPCSREEYGWVGFWFRVWGVGFGVQGLGLRGGRKLRFLGCGV